ncbi:MAG: hypothetical protein A2776_03000 [Candidatus Levybacteria bacterium RIFCSPHIGHO2_01_FULL_40_10]|nr:MAG: hypothetical protein A2776_03000 [Candidatus Levybacteria bacterium RIFCSPHIGHO2_01_FULL_40_10]
MKTVVNRIAFDFDGVFVDHPPFIPKGVIESLYKKKQDHLSYRMPGKLEQKIREISHSPFLRLPINDHLEALKKISAGGGKVLYLISSRFSFLKQKTDEWDKRNKISQYFKKVYFNFGDEQPHLYKERILRSEKIDKFIDDDLDLLLYLAGRNPKVKFYWLTRDVKQKNLPQNIYKIKTLEELITGYL